MSAMKCAFRVALGLALVAVAVAAPSSVVVDTVNATAVTAPTVTANAVTATTVTATTVSANAVTTNAVTATTVTTDTAAFANGYSTTGYINVNGTTDTTIAAGVQMILPFPGAQIASGWTMAPNYVFSPSIRGLYSVCIAADFAGLSTFEMFLNVNRAGGGPFASIAFDSVTRSALCGAVVLNPPDSVLATIGNNGASAMIVRGARRYFTAFLITRLP